MSYFIIVLNTAFGLPKLRDSSANQVELRNLESDFVFYCDSSRSYDIKSTEQLKKMSFGDLECLYRAGVVPPQVPTGFWEGTMLGTNETDLVGDIASSVWRGKEILEGKCETLIPQGDKQIYMALNKIGEGYMFPGHTYIGELDDSGLFLVGFGSMERHLIVDYSANWDSFCPVFYTKDLVYDNLRVPSMMQSIIDIIRIVGKTSAGKYILLGKALRRRRSGNETSTSVLAYWAAETKPTNDLKLLWNSPIRPKAGSFVWQQELATMGVKLLKELPRLFSR